MIRKFQFKNQKYKVDLDDLQGYDLVQGQVLFFKRKLFSGSYRNPKYIGYEEYLVEIISESYGSTGQHTFTLKVIKAFDKRNERNKGDKIMIKGRNLYPNCKVLVNPEAVFELREMKHRRAFMAKYWMS